MQRIERTFAWRARRPAAQQITQLFKFQDFFR
jgi:hypothetical protein